MKKYVCTILTLMILLLEGGSLRKSSAHVWYAPKLVSEEYWGLSVNNEIISSHILIYREYETFTELYFPLIDTLRSMGADVHVIDDNTAVFYCGLVELDLDTSSPIFSLTSTDDPRINLLLPPPGGIYAYFEQDGILYVNSGIMVRILNVICQEVHFKTDSENRMYFVNFESLKSEIE